MTNEPDPTSRVVWAWTIDLSQRRTRLVLVVLLIVFIVIVRELQSGDSGTEEGASGAALSADLPYVVALAPANAFNQQIVLADPGSGTVTPVTEAAHGVIDYAVSPSGTRIAYAQNNADETADLWLLDLSQGVEHVTTRPLTHCVNARCRNPAWSPDERQIVYQREDFLPEPGRGLSDPRVWTVDIVTVQTQLLISDAQVLGADPAWSPDGTHIAVYDPALGGVCVYHMVGHIIGAEPDVEVVIDTVPETAGVWSPDGGRLLYPFLVRSVRGVEFYTHLEIAVITHDSRVPVTGPYDTPIEEGGADWSPDGRTLLLARRYMDERYTAGKQIVWLDLLTGAAETLVTDPQFTHAAPQWDSTGRWIVYQRFDLVTVNAQPEIWVYDTVTGNTQLVIENAFFPGWGP